MTRVKPFIDAYCHIGEGVHYRQSPEGLLGQMDALGIDLAILAPADHHTAVQNVEGNDLVLRAVETWPDRFWGYATVNPWYGAAAVREFRRAIRAGLCGLNLDPGLQGFITCDPLVFPLVEAAIEFDVPIYVNTGVPVYGEPMQLVELALTYPQARLIMGHMGNTDFWIDVPAALAQAPNIWAELSYNLSSVVGRAIAAGNVQRLMFGSDSPMADLGLEVSKIDYWVATEDQKADILAGNLLRLFGKNGGIA